MADPDCEPNPDIAGIGVVVAFLLTAALSLLLAQFCIWANLFTDKEHPPQWLLGRVLARAHDWVTRDTTRKGLERWQNIFEALMISLSLTQAITGAALWLCVTITYETRHLSPYSNLAMDLATLSIWTEIPMLLALRHVGISSVQLRIVFIAVFSFCLSVSNMISHSRSDPGVVAASVILMLFSICWLVPSLSYMVGLVRSRPGKLSAWISWQQPYKDAYTTFLARPLMRFLAVWVFCLLNVWFFAECVTARNIIKERCKSNEGQDNQWTFGQFLALFMVTNVIFSAWDAYFVEKDKDDNDSDADSESPPADVEAQTLLAYPNPNPAPPTPGASSLTTHEAHGILTDPIAPNESV